MHLKGEVSSGYTKQGTGRMDTTGDAMQRMYLHYLLPSTLQSVLIRRSRNDKGFSIVVGRVDGLRDVRGGEGIKP